MTGEAEHAILCAVKRDMGFLKAKQRQRKDRNMKKQTRRRKVSFYSKYAERDGIAYVTMVTERDGVISYRAYRSLLRRMGLDRYDYHWAYQLRSENPYINIRIIKRDDVVGYVD